MPRVIYMWPAELMDRRSARIEATDTHELWLHLENARGKSEKLVLRSPADGTLRVIGPGHRRVAMLPTVVVEVALAGQPPFQLLANETITTYAPRWSASHASLAGNTTAPAVATAPLDETQLTLPCGTCGSPMGSPVGQTAMRCAHCGNHVEIPAELAARRAFLVGCLQRARQAADLFDEEAAMRLRLLERDGHARATMLAALPTAGILLAFVVVPLVSVRFGEPVASFRVELLYFLQACGWLGGLVGIVAGMLLAKRKRQRIYRAELRPLLACLPPHAGVPARCRYCGGAIQVIEGLVPCEYCGATNLATARLAPHVAGSQARRAQIFDDRAADVRAAERAHLATLATSLQRGHAWGGIVIAPFLAVGLAALLAVIRLA